MFNIGLGELLFIAMLALIFIGPERLPKVMRQMGEWVGKARAMVSEVTAAFGDELKPIEELRSLANDLKPMRQLTNIIEPRPGATSSAAVPPSTQAPPALANPIAMIGRAMAEPRPAEPTPSP